MPRERETKAFKQLAAYMARYNELETIGPAWQPFECFSDASGLLGAALAPWLRGGARYLQFILEPLDLKMVAQSSL